MADSKYIDLIASYLSGNISAPERTELLRWAESSQENQKFFDEMVQLWSITEAYEEEPFEADIPAAWNKLDQRIGDGNTSSAGHWLGKIIPLSSRSGLFRVAAATLLLIAASYGVYSAWISSNEPQPVLYAEVFTQEDESKEVELPDGTKIWLNENTKLSYLETFAERTIELTGEAFFDVAHQEDSPFVITTGEVRTTVLGTAFNLRAYPEEEQVEVTVQRGKVRLEKASMENETIQPDKVVMLEQGDTGVFDLAEQKATRYEDQGENSDAWKTGALNFDGLEMDRVITVLERYYDVDFDVANGAIRNCLVTSLEFQDQPLDTVLAGISYMLTLNYEQPSDSVVVLTGQGCIK